MPSQPAAKAVAVPATWAGTDSREESPERESEPPNVKEGRLGPS